MVVVVVVKWIGWFCNCECSHDCHRSGQAISTNRQVMFCTYWTSSVQSVHWCRVDIRFSFPFANVHLSNSRHPWARCNPPACSLVTCIWIHCKSPWIENLCCAMNRNVVVFLEPVGFFDQGWQSASPQLTISFPEWLIDWLNLLTHCMLHRLRQAPSTA